MQDQKTRHDLHEGSPTRQFAERILGASSLVIASSLFKCEETSRDAFHSAEIS